MDDRLPLVSVVIPYYKCLAYIGEALDSALAQTYPRYEVILVNDGSPDRDELLGFLGAYGNRVRYVEQAHAGLGAARNTGIFAADGDLIALLDADDRWEPQYLSVQVTEMMKDPTIDLVYSNALIFGDAPDAGRTYMEMNPSEGPVTFESLVRQQCTVMVSVLARREALVRVGLFDESLPASEDWDLWLRMVADGSRVTYHRQILVHYRRRRGSLSSDPTRMSAAMLRVLDKARDTLTLTPARLEMLDGEYRRLEASARLHEAKRAFFRRDPPAAVEALRDCNRYFKSAKLAAAIVLIRLVPGVLLQLYDLRDRLVFRTSTRF